MELTPPAHPATTAPRYSIVTAVYNVGRYLADFIAAVEGQSLDRAEFEVIAVDDGSTDDSLAQLQQWAARSPGRVTVLTKENGGQASARNLGIEHAVGEWVTFPDPDDVLEPTYLSEVDTFLRAHPQTPMVATYRVLLDDETGEIRDRHPLRAHFAGRNALRYLDGWPTHFHGSAPAAFFRRSRIEALHLRFDPEVRPNFEDGHFCVRYLLAQERPAVGFVKTAVYRYRKRADSSSTLQTSLSNPDRYTKVLRNGYLAVLRQSVAARGRPPEWLQNYIVYELSWYFTSQDLHANTGGSATGEVATEFHALMAEICPFLDQRVVESFRLRKLPPTLRHILNHAYRAERWHEEHALVDRLDEARRLARLRYHVVGDLPDEVVSSGGEVVSPAFAKTRALTYHDKVVIRERILWVPSHSTIRLILNGEPTQLLTEPARPPSYGLSATQLRKAFTDPEDQHERATAAAAELTRRDRALLRLAASAPVRRRFADAWVLMDRIHNADDSAEVLFRYLRKSRPKINAWFVVESGTSDWKRLRAAGYRRVVAHGSTLWKLLMLNARHLISSHADRPVMEPPEILRLAEPSWQFTFLQHGVIKDDLSGWLNRKPIDTFVTSTRQEYESVAGDGNAYLFTPKEVQLTGLPRFDKLRRIGASVPESGRDLVLVAPTWRQWLLPRLDVGSQRRKVRDNFFDSEFARQWLGLLQSPAVADLCRERGLSLGLLPHPNLESAVPGLELPSYVQLLSYDVPDVQQYFARAAVLVTDYSSIAFNAAYIERPVVYFQFDADKVLGGAHVGKQGYFSYERDGFGPVTSTIAEAEAAIVDAIRAGLTPSPLYQQRIADTFPERDGKCSKRVTDAIIASGKRWRP